MSQLTSAPPSSTTLTRGAPGVGLTRVVTGRDSSLWTRRVKVRRGFGCRLWQRRWAAQAAKRLLNPRRALSQNPPSVTTCGGTTEPRLTLRIPSGCSRMKVSARSVP
jgi:hypothetical protein